MLKAFRVTWLLAVLAAWLGVVTFWWRSHGILDEWSAVDEGNTLRAVVSFKGAIHVIRAGRNASPRELGWDTIDVAAGLTHADLHFGRPTMWRFAGFARQSAAAPPAPVRRAPLVMFNKPAPLLPPAAVVVPAPVPATPPMSAAVAPWLLTWPYDAWIIPYWPAVAVLSIPLLREMFLILRRRHRRLHQRCADCGYDVRESPERCPECGLRVPRPRGTANAATSASA